MTDKLAFDRSMRSKDGNGHLIVERTVLSKAAVNTYRGKEIPGYEKLGLDPERVYHMLRDSYELEKAASTFSKKQLLIRHIPVNASDPKKEDTVGAIGSDITFEDGRLYGDLGVWDEYAIELIESGKMQELSSAYAYVPDMTPGEYQGVKYDGVMRDIRANHVALVEKGRIGPDAIISDHKTVDLEKEMKLKKGALTKIAEKIRLAMDSDLSDEGLRGVVDEVMENVEKTTSNEKPEGAKDTAPEPPEGGKKPEGASDEENDKDKKAKEEDKKPAMDAAMIEQRAVERVTALFQAREDVKPLIGIVAMDSAEDVYAAALKQKGVDVSGVHPSAYKSMVGMLLSNQASATKPNVAMDYDSFADDPLTARFG
ncbi:DUF2213 domain-containing protein [Photorhabdus sp. RM71S]|uniref:DUF2213 domain-containing protein n=1 Tax=Photorhabdus sp. RM71S TaxID=3342824 RepID=UPI0036D92B11